jgi:integrase
MENPMTPSIVKNGRVRTRISYMSADQLERFLRAAKEYGAREHAMFLFAVAHGTRDEKAALKAWLAVREPDADEHVFNSQKSTQLNRVTVFKLFREIAKRAGLSEALQHPHVLKHTAAMLLVQQGANAFLIRQAVGHKSFDSTLAYVNPSDADASAALAKAFNQAV